jgi:hypothetical protein
MSTSDPYYELPKVGPYEVRIGSGLITMVEPHVGHDHAYNRWYEDDHYYAGCLAMPWMFAGRRWVAPVDLQKLRYPADSAIAQPIEAGKYIATYWITDGRYEDHMRWTVSTNQRLFADGRVFQERTHVFTSFQKYRGAWYRDTIGPRDIHALDHDYGGLVVEVIDSADSDGRDRVIAWMRDERAPSVMGGSPVAMGLAFQPQPLPGDKQPYMKDVEGVDDRLTVLWFTEGDPRDAWDVFAGAGKAVEASGLGRVELIAPFLPTIVGTDTYVDQLR